VPTDPARARAAISRSASFPNAVSLRKSCSPSGPVMRGISREGRPSAAIRAVVAWGGDGTINEVASALAFGTVPLAIVPAGSGNGLARELGISTRPERALATAIAGRTRTIDMGDVEGHLFVNLAGVGVDAHVASSFNVPENRRRGFPRLCGRDGRGPSSATCPSSIA
jgi:diacylglycerol kinase family enzyme